MAASIEQKMGLRPGVRAPLRPQTKKAAVTKSPSARAAATQVAKGAVTGSRKVRQPQKRSKRLMTGANKNLFSWK